LDLQRGGPGAPITVVDLSGIEGFRQITESDEDIILAGGVTHAQVVAHAGLTAHALPLVQACAEIGSPQLRNRATVAGNIATASPANDSISALMALGASLELCRAEADGTLSTREVPIAEFFDGFRSTVMAADEVIRSIRVPKLAANERGAWVKLGLRKAQAISVVHAGLVVGIDEGVVSSARLAMGSVAATVVVIGEFEDALNGRPLDDDVITAAAEAAGAAVSPIDDVRATAEYRAAVIEPLLARALRAIRDDAVVTPDEPPVLAVGAADAWPTANGQAITDDVEIEVTVNGTTVRADGAASRTLLDWLRDKAGGWSSLTGTKEGCAEGECGACTVSLDGAAVMSCLVAAAQADQGTVVTIEGLAEPDGPTPLQTAFVDCFAVQCGFCIPGFVMAGTSLLEEVPNPTDEQIDIALSGNLCRCTGYYPIREAVRTAARGANSATA
ncbi:MAG: 2Fe-2S iron-sulfur cluster binding domain-containing protein, partial [Acidimicrobiales bacterium]|nr:2Fe-2S iron-sulfur cluster binding domain-containing protein [Acidimicrobiales bacterium]